MKLAFYAPLKSPHHPVPSGDRAMSRALIAALAAGGCFPELASDFRSREPEGDADAQARLIAQADALVPTLIEKGRTAGWHVWVTYHNYYKAPDLLGPAVSRALSIPYVLIEATRARKRLTGPWARFGAAAEAASDAAALILYFTQRDAEALRRDAPKSQKLLHLPPFLARSDLPLQTDYSGPMLSVGMMRKADKLASYQVIAETLRLLKGPWRLDIVGDGPVREDVESLMAPFSGQVRFLGKLNAADLAEVYGHARLLFWPGVNEAFGMTYLEAQAHGVPVVAQNRPGVCDVLAPGLYPDPAEGADALANLLRTVLDAPRRVGTAAREHIAACHLMPAATRTLMHGLGGLDR